MQKVTFVGIAGMGALLLICGIAAGQTADQPGRLARLLAARPLVNKTLTIEEAVAIALKESPVVRGAASEVDAAEGRIGAARAQTRPFVSANTFASGGSNANIIASPGLIQPQMIQALPRDAFVDQNLSVMFPLYTGGRLTALIRQASALRDATDAERQMKRQDTVLLTRIAYRQITAERALVEVQRARLKENEERLRLDRVRLQQERIPAYYVQRDEAEVAAATQEVTNAERDVEISLGRLKMAMGVNPASQMDVTATEEADKPVAEIIAEVTRTETPPLPLTGGLEDKDLVALLHTAEGNRPELLAAARRVQGAAEGVTAARGMYRPQISLFGMGDAIKAKNQSGFAGVTYGVVAAIPLYNGGERRANIETADAERRLEEDKEEQVALQVAQEVRAALLNLRAAGQNVATAKSGVIAAQEEYRVAQLRYEAGRSIVTEALDAQTSRVRAEGNVVQARFQYRNANDQLRRAVGRIAPS